MRALLVIAFVACAPRAQGPTAIVRFVTPAEWTTADVASIQRGLSAWGPLGFITGVEVKTALRRCSNLWHQIGETKCVLEIGIRRELGLIDRYNHAGQADRVTDTITVDATLHGERLQHTVAHEVGHILLNTSKHTTHGVMTSGGWMWDLSAKDRELACDTIQRGCK